MEKISLLHFADLHIGVENYGRLDSATGIGGTPPAGATLHDNERDEGIG